MAERAIECPSGLRGTVRNLKGAEFNLLADRKGMRDGENFDRILARCWVQTESAGRAYREDQLAPIRWSRMLNADRFFALVQIRAATWGDSYDFALACPECGERQSDSVLLSELDVLPVPDDSCAAFREGNNRFPLWVPDPAGLAPPEGFEPARLALRRLEEGKWPDDLPSPERGWAIAARLLTGLDEVAGNKESRKRPEERVSISVKYRVAELLHEELTGGKGALERWIESLDGEILYDVLDACESCDGGIETEREFECASCGCDDPVELPFGRDFWTPRRRRKSGGRGKRPRRRRRRR